MKQQTKGDYAEAIDRIIWKLAILVFAITVLCRFGHMEAEHNAIIDRLDKAENNITEHIDKKFPAEEPKDTEENLGGEFKSWMSFQTTVG